MNKKVTSTNLKPYLTLDKRGSLIKLSLFDSIGHGWRDYEDQVTAETVKVKREKWTYFFLNRDKKYEKFLFRLKEYFSTGGMTYEIDRPDES